MLNMDAEENSEQQHPQYLIEFTRSGTYMKSATSSKYATNNLASDLLTFVEVAQAFGIDFLPVTWQPASDGIGTGATGMVSSSMINDQTSQHAEMHERS